MQEEEDTDKPKIEDLDEDEEDEDKEKSKDKKKKKKIKEKYTEVGVLLVKFIDGHFLPDIGFESMATKIRFIVNTYICI